MSEPARSPAPARAGFPRRTPGHTLPAAYYLDPDVFAAELATVFGAGWLFAGHSCELAAPGDYLLLELGHESVIVVRDEERALRGHHNVCRHRPSRLCASTSGVRRGAV